MNFQSLMNSRLGVGIALGLGKAIPTRSGYPLASWIADRISGIRRLGIVQAVRANQWVVSGESFSAAQLDDMTRSTFRSTAYFLYDLYHNLDNPEKMMGRVEFSPKFQEYVRLSQEARSGFLFVCPHLGNLDLVGRAISLSGLDVQILSYPEPPGGYRWQNQLRRKGGLNITPMSVSTLRQAGEHLKAGGFALTGLDRPLPGSKYRPQFFGRPTALPVSYVRLALKSQVPVVVLACILKSDGKYHVEASEPIHMQSDNDLNREILKNAEPVLEIAAGFIRQAPHQWAMFYPLWPEVLERTP